MRSSRFAAVGERLLEAGIAPRHARRAVTELTDHFDDLVAELESQGYARNDAEAEAGARLNTDALIAAAGARPELRSRLRRWPLASCTVLPLSLYAAYVFGSIMVLVGGITALDRCLSITLSSSLELARFAAIYMSGIAWAVPIFAAGTFCSIAQARRMPFGWTVLGAVLVSLVGATLNAELVFAPDSGPNLNAGIGFSTDALTQPLLRATLTLAVVLPIYCWQRAIALGRVRKPSPSQLIAIVIALALHIAISALIPARAPRTASETGDPAMTLIIVPPRSQLPTATSTPELAAQATPLAPTGATPITPPQAPSPLIEPEQIDFAREAELATQRAVAAIELERRRARGFTPREQNREPEVARTPAPEFGWSSTAQRVEALPEGGILVRLSERCVIAVTLVAFPACSFGEIPVNGDLFEHMKDAPKPGDWKDDSAALR